jgi:hypothetical protein
MRNSVVTLDFLAESRSRTPTSSTADGADGATAQPSIADPMQP